MLYPLMGPCLCISCFLPSPHQHTLKWFTYLGLILNAVFSVKPPWPFQATLSGSYKLVVFQPASLERSSHCMVIVHLCICIPFTPRPIRRKPYFSSLQMALNTYLMDEWMSRWMHGSVKESLLHSDHFFMLFLKINKGLQYILSYLDMATDFWNRCHWQFTHEETGSVKRLARYHIG